jgi:hypothetical protein
MSTIEGLGIEVDPNPLFDWYYGLVDFEFWLRKYGGEDVVAWVKANVHPLDIVFRLAEDHGIVLLTAAGSRRRTGRSASRSRTSTTRSTRTSGARCGRSRAAT